jgi:hypothetical protein
MGTLLILIFLLAVAPLSVIYGADSRTHDPRTRERWWPGFRGGGN